ncbi:N-acyl homoserine lactonase family protein [Halocatena halophila]|uniref:N-acyl homoserine lactonase family protein n=1 Tax=Halocatena halophila TaxID=2814576 RepID=UPI002ED67273
MVNAEIHLVDRGTIRADLNYFIEGYTRGSAADPNPDVEMGTAPVYNLVIDHPDGTILWDTGSHPDAGNGHWPEELYAAFQHYDAHERDLETALDDSGFEIGDIDYVFQTHLHIDHAGSLHQFAGADTPIFVHEKEIKYAYYSAKTDEGGIAYVLEDFDHDLNWQVLRRTRETHFEDVEFIHLPGHTPGTIGTMVHLENTGTVLFAGDTLYLRPNYDDEKPLGSGVLWSKQHWFDSLSMMKELERKHNADVFCGHDPGDVERLRSGLS